METLAWKTAEVVAKEFFLLHGYALQRQDLAGPMPPEQFTSDYINGLVTLLGYAQLNGLRAAGAGRQGWFCVLVVPQESPIQSINMFSVPTLRVKLKSILTAIKQYEPDGIMILAPSNFGRKKGILTEISTISTEYGISIQACDIAAFTQNPLKHVLNPINSRILSEAERAELPREVCAAVELLPTMRADDPISLWLRARPGQVVRHERPSHTAATAVDYNLIV